MIKQHPAHWKKFINYQSLKFSQKEFLNNSIYGKHVKMIKLMISSFYMQFRLFNRLYIYIYINIFAKKKIGPLKF